MTEELAGWKFSTKEVSAGVFEVEGVDAHGRVVSKTGTDDLALLEDCKNWARAIEARAKEPGG